MPVKNRERRSARTEMEMERHGTEQYETLPLLGGAADVYVEAGAGGGGSVDEDTYEHEYLSDSAVGELRGEIALTFTPCRGRGLNSARLQRLVTAATWQLLKGPVQSVNRGEECSGHTGLPAADDPSEAGALPKVACSRSAARRVGGPIAHQKHQQCEGEATHAKVRGPFPTPPQPTDPNPPSTQSGRS